MMNPLCAANNAIPMVLAVLTWTACLDSAFSQSAPVPQGKPTHYPEWWFKRGVIQRLNLTNSNPVWPTDYSQADDFAVFNLGQLKHVAKGAAAELQAGLPGGSGAAVQELVRSFDTVNLSLEPGVTATQSSTGWDAPAARAIDGNTEGQFYIGNSVTHTSDDTDPWWQADLGSSRTIRNVEVWNRTDCCGERTDDFYVLISNSVMAGRSLADLLSDTAVWKSPKITTPPSPNMTVAVGVQTGRYVMIRIAGVQFLSLAEVKVNGSRKPGLGASDDYAAANIGQLKSVAKPYYDRLIAAGYAAGYPWSGQAADDYLVPNVGQLKAVFSFDLTKDVDGDGIPDWQDSDINPDGDSDGDGLTNSQEVAMGTNPTKKDNPSVQLTAFGFTAP